MKNKRRRKGKIKLFSLNLFALCQGYGQMPFPIQAPLPSFLASREHVHFSLRVCVCVYLVTSWVKAVLIPEKRTLQSSTHNTRVHIVLMFAVIQV